MEKFNKFNIENSFKMHFEITLPRDDPPQFEKDNNYLNLLCNTIIFITAFGMFCYVNSYLTPNMLATIKKYHHTDLYQYWTCDNFYCDQITYNFINNPDLYYKCNSINCQTPLCSNYNCSDQNNDLNRFYSCCYNQNQNIPLKMIVGTILAITSASIYTFMILISILSAIYFCCNPTLSRRQKICLYLNFLVPHLKYFILRQRVEWQRVKFNFRLLILIDTIIISGLFISFVIYIVLGIFQFFSMIEIITTFILGSSFIQYINVISRNGNQFKNLDCWIRTGYKLH